MAEKCCYNILMNFLGGREGEDKRGQENGQTWIFWGVYIKKISTFIFWVHGRSSWSTFGLHLVRGPKGFVN
jgi:hypothetical protein